MSDLVPLPDVVKFCGIGSTEDNVAFIEAIAIQVESWFLAECHRTGRPFQVAQPARTEVRDSSGGPVLFTDYPMAAVTSLKLGYDPAAPEETIDPADRTKVVWGAGDRRIARVDGRWFGCLGRPRYVEIVYDAQDDLPEDAKLAILRVTAAVFRESDVGEATVERKVDETLAELPRVADRDFVWRQAVAAHWEPQG